MTISVLLVEDDEVVRTSMCFALASSQVRVIEAGTVAEGLRRFHDDVVDVVVIDLHLPDGTGHDLARWLWQQQPQLPLVMITSDPEAAGVAPLRQLNGRSTMLIKPFSISALLDAISVVVADPPGLAHG